MPGFMPGTHAFTRGTRNKNHEGTKDTKNAVRFVVFVAFETQDVDARDEPGHGVLVV